MCTPRLSPNKKTCTVPYLPLLKNTREELKSLSQLISDDMPNFHKQLAKIPGLNLDQYTAEDFTELEVQLSTIPLPSSNSQSKQKSDKQDLKNVLAMKLDQGASVKAIQDSQLSPFEHPLMMSSIQPCSNGHTVPPNVPYNATQRGRSWTLPSGFRQPDIGVTTKLSNEDLIAAGQEYMALLYGLDQAHPEEHTRRSRELRQLLGHETVSWLKSKGVESQHIFEADRMNWIDVCNVPSGMQHPPPPFSSKEVAEKFDLMERGYDNIDDELTEEQESQEVLICEDTAVSIFGPNIFGYEKEVHPELWSSDDTFTEGIPCVLSADFESLIDEFYRPISIETFVVSEAMDLDTSNSLEAPLTNEHCEYPPPTRADLTPQKEVVPQKLSVCEVVGEPTLLENRTRFRLKTSAPTSSAEWSWGEPPAKRTRAPSQTPKPQTNTFHDVLSRVKKDTQSIKQLAKGKTVSAPLKSTYKAAQVEDDNESGSQPFNLKETWEVSANKGVNTIQNHFSQESLRHRLNQYQHIPVSPLSPGAPNHGIALSGPFVSSQLGFRRSVAGSIQAPIYDPQTHFQGSMNAHTFGDSQYSQNGCHPHQQWNAGNRMQLPGSLPNQNPALQVPVNFNSEYSISFPPNSSHGRDSPFTKHKNHNRTFSGGSGANAEPIQPHKQRKSRPEPLKFATVVPDNVLGDIGPVSSPSGVSNSFPPLHSTNRHRQQNVQQSPEKFNSIPTYHRTSSVSPDKKRGVRRGRGSPKKDISSPSGTLNCNQLDATPSNTRLRPVVEDTKDFDDTPIKLNLGQSPILGKVGPREFAVISFTDIATRAAGEKSLENKIKNDHLYMTFKVVADLSLKRLDLKVSGQPGSNVRGQLKNLFPHHHIDVAMACIHNSDIIG